MSAPYRLYAPGLELSVPRMSEVERLAEVCDDPEISAWICLPAPYTRADAEVFLTTQCLPGWENDAIYTWAIRRSPDLVLDGVISLSVGTCRSVELGYYVAGDARGHGLATAAVRRVLAEALDPGGIGAQRVLWRAVVGNWASRRVAWKCGFSFEGTVRRELVFDEQRRDAWVATLLPGEALSPRGAWDGPERR